MKHRRHDHWLSGMGIAHALYFIPSSIWALVHIRSFEKVTGPKVDRWLVKTVAGLLTVIGVVIGRSGMRQRVTPEIAALAIGSSGVLTAIDLVYVRKKRIAPVYLLDAIANLLLIGGWIAALRRGATR
ncbi:MAG TPA: hypothetical protein VM450_08720 [Thermomicrobiales bacterium]|nr:hypothetical protein [Thermomicrobiales bacterium]